MANIYNNACSDNNMIYIKNSEFILHDYYNQFSSDGIHPNQTGEKAIARYLVNGLKTGSCNVKYNKTDVISGNTYLYTTMSNEITSLVLYNAIYLNFSVEGPISCSGNNAIKIATIDGGQIYNSNANLRGLINAVFVDNSAGYNKYYDVPCYIKINGDELLLYPFKTNSDNTNYLSIKPIAVQLRPFSLTFDSTYI